MVAIHLCIATKIKENKMIKEKFNNALNRIKYGEESNLPFKEGYIEFTSQKEIDEWGNKYYSEWSEKYGPVFQRFSKFTRNSLFVEPVEQYCGYKYREINHSLRYDEDNQYRVLADILSVVICSAPPIPCDLIGYRLVSDDVADKMFNIKHLKKTDIGIVPYLEKGFMSISLSKNITKLNEHYSGNNNLLKVYIRNGIDGIYVNSITSRPEEEIILRPNLYVKLMKYPYKDVDTGKIVYECYALDL